jgi:hypothetical protein
MRDEAKNERVEKGKGQKAKGSGGKENIGFGFERKAQQGNE